MSGENRPGVMGPYHPLIHYMSRPEFESIGNRTIKSGDVPTWKDANTKGSGFPSEQSP
jgi:hypothetical protein